jgi:hypothetical protein
LAYESPASSTFLSEQINHQQSASSTFLSEQISWWLSTNNQPAVLFSQNKSAGAISHQPNEQAENRPLVSLP